MYQNKSNSFYTNGNYFCVFIAPLSGYSIMYFTKSESNKYSNWQARAIYFKQERVDLKIVRKGLLANNNSEYFVILSIDINTVIINNSIYYYILYLHAPEAV